MSEPFFYLSKKTINDSKTLNLHKKIEFICTYQKLLVILPSNLCKSRMPFVRLNNKHTKI